MKIFLFTATLYDGEHEHMKHTLIKAKDWDSAWEIGKNEMHDVGEDDNGKYWNYGDGQTATSPKYIEEISQDEAAVLTKLNIVHFLN